jgi:hypothetical protein
MHMRPAFIRAARRAHTRRPLGAARSLQRRETKNDTSNHSLRGQIMSKSMQAFFLGTLLAFVGSALAVAGDMPDAAVGTWTINLAKSKFGSGPPPKSMTRTYTQSDQGISITIEGVSADGSPISQKSTFKYDGKDYAFTGAPLFDSLSLKRVDANTITSTQKKAGKVVGTTTRKVSADGKMLTVSTKGTTAKGEPFEDVSVYDRK